MNAVSIALLVIIVPAASQAVAATCDDLVDASSTIFVSPAWLSTNMDSVTVLDARGPADYDAGHLASAARAGWQTFTAGCPGVSCGVLNTTAFMTSRFAELGVSPTKTVVIYGGWQSSWGYEARIQWMLKSLGHKKAFILSGGIAAYIAKYKPTLSTTAVTPTAVSLSEWSSGLDVTGFEDIVETKAGIESTDLLIDTRTEGEYTGEKSGSNNYNVLRDGHATGAVLFSFGDFFNGTCLKTCTAFKADLTSRGWTPARKLVAYCTAGIRSSFFWSFATHCGVPHVSNYAGSMWEYAADSSKSMTATFVKERSESISDANAMFSAGGLLLALAPLWMRA